MPVWVRMSGLCACYVYTFSHGPVLQPHIYHFDYSRRVSPSLPFILCMFALLQQIRLQTCRGEGHVHQFESHSLRNAVFYYSRTRGSFQTRRPQLNLHGLRRICSLWEAARPAFGLVSDSLSPSSEAKLSGSRICLVFCFSWPRLKV